MRICFIISVGVDILTMSTDAYSIGRNLIMITLQILIAALVAELPFSGNTFSVWDIALIGLITIVVRLAFGKLLKIHGLANAISFNLSLMTAAVPMIHYIWWHASNEAEYSVSSNVWMLILCGIIWFVFWRFINPWYYTKVDDSYVAMSYIPYFENSVVLRVIDGIIQLLPMTIFVAFVWYGFAGHFSPKAIAGLVLANVVWVAVFLYLVARAQKNHPEAVIEDVKDPYSDHVENETESRFEVKLSDKNYKLFTVCKILVLYAAFCLDGLYYDRIHNDLNEVFSRTAGIPFLISVLAILAAYLLQERLSLRLIVNKNRFGIHKIFSFGEVVDEKDMVDYELIGKNGSGLALTYFNDNNNKEIRFDGAYENITKLKNYITSETAIERFVPKTAAQKKEELEKRRAEKAAQREEDKRTAPERKAAKKAKKLAEKERKEAERELSKERSKVEKEARKKHEERERLAKKRKEKRDKERAEASKKESEKESKAEKNA